MYPKSVPDIVDDNSNLTSLDNSYDTIKKDRNVLVGGKKCGLKPVSNIKSNKTH